MAADNLKGDEYVFLLVQGYNSQRHLIPWGAGFDTAQTSPIPPGEYSKQRVFNSRIGPRPDGTAEATFEILVNEQWYEQFFVEAALITGETPEERLKRSGRPGRSSPELTTSPARRSRASPAQPSCCRVRRAHRALRRRPDGTKACT